MYPYLSRLHNRLWRAFWLSIWVNEKETKAWKKKKNKTRLKNTHIEKGSRYTYCMYWYIDERCSMFTTIRMNYIHPLKLFLSAPCWYGDQSMLGYWNPFKLAWKAAAWCNCPVDHKWNDLLKWNETIVIEDTFSCFIPLNHLQKNIEWFYEIVQYLLVDSTSFKSQVPSDELCWKKG